jgi:sorbitol-specific phosphotransferase system component IIC
MGTNDTVIALTSESGHNVAMTTHSSDITSSYVTSSNVTSSSLHTFHLNSTDLHTNASETEVHPGIVSGIDGLGTSVTIAVALSSVAFVVVIGKNFF